MSVARSHKEQDLRDRPVMNIAQTWTPQVEVPDYQLGDDFVWGGSGVPGVTELNTDPNIFQVDTSGITTLIFYGLYQIEFSARYHQNAISTGAAFNGVITIDGIELTRCSSNTHSNVNNDKKESEKTTNGSILTTLDKSRVISGHIDLVVGNTSNSSEITLLVSASYLSVTRIR